MRHGERCPPTVRGDPTPVEVGTGVIRVQVAQGDHPQQPGPCRVRAPLRGRGKPARDHGDRRGGQARQKPVAHPLVEMGEDLVAVQEQDQPLVGRQGDGFITVRHVHTTRAASSTLSGPATSRPSRRTTCAPASPAEEAYSSRSALLPTPPGPCTNRTRKSGSFASSAAAKTSSSAARPTKCLRRRAASTPPSVSREGSPRPVMSSIVSACGASVTRPRRPGGRYGRGSVPVGTSTRRSRVTSARVRHPVRAMVRSSSARMLRSTSATPSSPASARP